MLDNNKRGEYGIKAVENGTPDYGQNGDGADGVEIDAADTVANVLHYVHGHHGLDADLVLDRARMHFTAEINGED